MFGCFYYPARMRGDKVIVFLPIVATPIDRAHFTVLLMRTTGPVEIVTLQVNLCAEGCRC